MEHYSIVEILNSRKSGILHIDGYLYYKDVGSSRRLWRCKKRSECFARATTEGDGESLVIVKGPKLSPHNHPPNYQAVKILKEKLDRLKRKSAECSTVTPPATIIPYAIIRELNAIDKDFNARLEPAFNGTINDRSNINQNRPLLKKHFNCGIPILVALKDMEKWDQLKKH